MIKSMTGFGRGMAQIENGSVTVEIRSSNNRYLELRTSISDNSFSFLIPKVEEMIRKVFCRGSIYTYISFVRNGCMVPVNINKLNSYLDIFARVRKRKIEGIEYMISLDSLLSLPGVINTEKIAEKKLLLGVEEACREAIDKLDSTRKKEGENLKSKIMKRIRSVERSSRKIQKLLPKIKKEKIKRLKANVRRGFEEEGIEFPESDFLREILIYTEKLDISEELDRIESHINQFVTTIEKGGRVGRKLDFIIQEMYREFTTIGSKTGDTTTGCIVVEIKTLLEEIREQVQNIE